MHSQASALGACSIPSGRLGVVGDLGAHAAQPGAAVEGPSDPGVSDRGACAVWWAVLLLSLHPTQPRPLIGCEQADVHLLRPGPTPAISAQTAESRVSPSMPVARRKQGVRLKGRVGLRS